MSLHYTATRLIVLSAAMITLTLLIYMAQPWGDNYPYQNLSGYIGLLGFTVWAILYFMILFLAKKASKTNNFVMIIGALIISLGGVSLYVDAALLHLDPQGALVFIVVPLCQWITLGLLAGFYFLLSKKQSSSRNTDLE